MSQMTTENADVFSFFKPKIPMFGFICVDLRNLWKTIFKDLYPQMSQMTAEKSNY